MDERTAILSELEQCGADIVQHAFALEKLCIFLRADGEGSVRCIAPDVDPASIARILYVAADTYASHAAKQIPASQIKRMR